MHVLLKPFLKILLLIMIVKGVAQLAGTDLDLDSLLGDAKEKLEGLTSEPAEAE